MSCPSCFAGSLHSGTPAGTETTLHGLPTYVSLPPADSPVRAHVVIIPDAFGWDLPNSRVLADNYARRLHAKVYLPDFMGGWGVRHDVLGSMRTATNAQSSILQRIPAGFSTLVGVLPFLLFTRDAAVAPALYAFFRGLRAETGLPIGVAGFCWGGKWAVCLGGGDGLGASGDQKTLVDAVFTAHPSGSALRIPEDLERAKAPVSIAVGTKDYMLPESQIREIQSVFSKKQNCEIVVYEGAEHGFAVRGNNEDERAVQQGMQAEDQAVNFFQKHLTSSTEDQYVLDEVCSYPVVDFE